MITGGIQARSDVALKACFDDPLLDVMEFLNGVVQDFPHAISFAPGRPLESLFDVETHLDAARTFVDSVAHRSGRDPAAVWRDLGQYTRASGIIADALAAHLAVDYGFEVAPEAILVTVGAQEAMAVLLAGLFDPPRDVLLVSDPTYIGITTLARLFGVRVVPVAAGPDGLEPGAVDAAIERASRDGRVRALYDIPDFNNPMGTSLSIADRHAVIEVCSRHRVLLIEDATYSLYAYDHPPRPSLKALDPGGQVIQIGSFAKTLFPGLRLGYLVADQRVTPGGAPLMDALARVKSALTVNTPPLMQAMLGGVLLQHGGSLAPVIAPKRAQYRQQRDAMVQALQREFAASGLARWSVPTGGFFLPLTVPFSFGQAELRACAEDYGVIPLPMRLFTLRDAHADQVRLAFSYVSRDHIDVGIARLAAYIHERAGRSAAWNGMAVTER